MRLRDRVALVTAAGSGMGRAGARRFAEEGAYVVVTDIDGPAAGETAKLITSAGGSAEAHELDVTATDSVKDLMAHIQDTRGALHVLYNHAGIPAPEGMDFPPEEWDHVVNVNMKAAFYVAAVALPLMRKANGKGSIIFTASTSGIVASPNNHPLYAMTKGGIVLLMRSLAVSAASDGIRVNAICPGPIATPMFPEFFGRERGSSTDDMTEGFVKSIPLGRQGQPEEVAAAAAFLASDDASFITGVALPVDGGYLA
jgi:NAD(P)-dependent dehydrogenase (short-subunit alcohol dehydrogenase family)